MCSVNYRGTKTSSRRTNNIEVLSEQLGSLQITKEASNEDKRTDTEILTAPAPVVNENGQVGMLKNMVPDPGWFDGDQTKFEDWWRGIRLFLKSNRVMEILAHLRGGVAGIYAQRKLDELDKETGTQDWEDFI